MLLSGYLFFRATWPYGFGEVVSGVLSPIIKRIVFLVLLLSNFRYFNRNVDPSMNFSEVFSLMGPILWSVLAVLLLPTMNGILGMVSIRRRKVKADLQLKKKYCYILFGSTRVNRNWTRFFQAQKTMLEYVVFICLLSPILLYYSWSIFFAYFFITNIYVATFAHKINFKTKNRITRFMASGLFVDFMKNLYFCVYLLVCAVIIWKSGERYPLEFIFFLIVGMRMQLARASNLASVFHSGLFERDFSLRSGNITG